MVKNNRPVLRLGAVVWVLKKFSIFFIKNAKDYLTFAFVCGKIIALRKSNTELNTPV